ncbi:hypothetical protein VTL71DRAFT_12446 [Oculimacula yallundae]|uniref:Transposase n=1 Tax=Oculimacula yallundae TaxID=86028 RepID=A0ABR4CPC6_9HELO
MGKFPKLESVDLLVPEKLHYYARYIEETYFGPCKKKSIRIVSICTREWIDEETAYTYWGYIDSWGGKHLGSMTRSTVEEEILEERLEDIQKLEMPRPRTNLDY